VGKTWESRFAHLSDQELDRLLTSARQKVGSAPRGTQEEREAWGRVYCATIMEMALRSAEERQALQLEIDGLRLEQVDGASSGSGLRDAT
jgi:hypothetical protein